MVLSVLRALGRKPSTNYEYKNFSFKTIFKPVWFSFPLLRNVLMQDKNQTDSRKILIYATTYIWGGKSARLTSVRFEFWSALVLTAVQRLVRWRRWEREYIHPIRSNQKDRKRETLWEKQAKKSHSNSSHLLQPGVPVWFVFTDHMLQIVSPS